MAEPWEGFVTTAATSLVTALVAAVGFWWRERRADRDRAQQRRRYLEEETAHIEYLRSWLEAQRLAGPGADAAAVNEAVRHELAESRERLTHLLADHPEADQPSPLARAWSSAVMTPLARPAAKVVRVLYWATALLGLLVGAFMISPSGESAEAPSSLGFRIVVALVVVVPFLGIALGFRGWARALERRYGAAAASDVDHLGTHPAHTRPWTPPPPTVATAPRPDGGQGGSPPSGPHAGEGVPVTRAARP